MLINPFTPSEMAREPRDFFGRGDELGTLERSLLVGSVIIQGPVGIGKSSLLTRFLLFMGGFDSDHRSKSVVAVGHKGVVSGDDAAFLLLEELVKVDEARKGLVSSLGDFSQRESIDVCRHFGEGRHLAALKKIMEQEYIDLMIGEEDFLLLAIDEADKCPVAIARLIRSIVTHTQHHGANRVRFLVAGVSPFLKEMIKEDSGIARFFSQRITVRPMFRGEATELLEHKFGLVRRQAREAGIEITIDSQVIPSIIELSGGHPHLMQLLGSRLIERENGAPDGTIDSHDLFESLCKICLDDRRWIYDAVVDLLEAHGHLAAFRNILECLPPTFPTIVGRTELCKHVGEEGLEWLVERDLMTRCSREHYRLVDEFLRVRLVFFDNE